MIGRFKCVGLPVRPAPAHDDQRGRRGGRAGETILVCAGTFDYLYKPKELEGIAHAAGAQVSGSGITLTAALTRSHASGTQVAGGLPTPGAPNQYYRKGTSAKD